MRRALGVSTCQDSSNCWLQLRAAEIVLEEIVLEEIVDEFRCVDPLQHARARGWGKRSSALRQVKIDLRHLRNDINLTLFTARRLGLPVLKDGLVVYFR
jgi:hypothetical protein